MTFIRGKISLTAARKVQTTPGRKTEKRGKLLNNCNLLTSLRNTRVRERERKVVSAHAQFGLWAERGSTLGPHGTLLALAIMRGANRACPKHESITLDYSTCQAMNWRNTRLAMWYPEPTYPTWKTRRLEFRLKDKLHLVHWNELQHRLVWVSSGL